MRVFTLGLLLWPSLVLGFPGAGGSHNDHTAHQALHKRCPYADSQGHPEAKHDKRFLFDSMKSPVDVTGEHAFQPPNFENGDQRGPCPGLNALANHAYIPRDGVVSVGHCMSDSNWLLV
ncbi:unnamed protein product [Penicillium bialowiezense]